MKIIGDSLAEHVASWLGEDYFPVTRRIFPDGELCPRFESSGMPTEGEFGVLVLQKTKEESTNDYVLNYILLLHAMKDAGFSRVAVVMPYFAYARQHKQYLSGQPVSAIVIAKTLEFSGADTFITVNAHEPGELQKLFSIPTKDLSIISLLAEFIAKKPEYENAAIVAPDDGAEELAKTLSKMLGNRDYTVFEKKRDVRTGDIRLTPKNAEMLAGRPVIIIDDMVSSGNTMVEAVRACSHHGATKTAALFVHPVFSENALEKLRACCDLIVSSNSIQSDVSLVDVSPIIAKALREYSKT